MNDSTNDELLNTVYHADCFDFLKTYSGPQFDLVYLDPPFFLDRAFKLEANSDKATFQKGWTEENRHDLVSEMFEATHSENLVNYLSWLADRLELISANMKNTSSLFLHIGTREAPYVAMVLDRVFGYANWRSTITWQRSHPHNNMTKSLGNVSDYIFYYSKSSSYTFNRLYTAHDEKYLANSFNNSDSKGHYALAPIIQERSRTGHTYVFNGYTPPNGWRVKEEELLRLDSLGYIHWGANRPYKKVYLAETEGALLQNIWTDVHNITRTEIDRRQYPTQKPLKLLERIIKLASNEGDLVYDPFCGSGTTAVAAKALGRKYLGTDISADAIEIAKSRLDQVMDSEKGNTLF